MVTATAGLWVLWANHRHRTGAMTEPTDDVGVLHLDVTVGNAAGNTILVDRRLVIGRSSDPDGRLADDEELSREHAAITREATGEYSITDLGSTNGTFVNGARLDAPVTLAVGDVVEVGASRLVVTRAPPAARRPAVDVRAPTVIVASTAPPAVPDEAASPPPPPPLSPADQDGVAATLDAVPEVAVARHGPGTSQSEQARPSPTSFELRVRIDLERGEVEISLGDGDDPLCVSLQDKRWQVRSGGQ